MGYSKAQAKAFIDYIAPIIIAEGTKRGYKVFSVTIAQAVIEGACNTSLLANKYHNHFGLKCGSAWKGKSVNLKTKEEYTVGNLTTIKDNFRAYDNDVEGIKGYYDFISTKRYANLKTATNYIEFATMLKADGYATSSTYINTLCNTVAKYNLTIYDNVSMPAYVVGKTYTLLSDLYIRDNADGNKVKVDSLTENAKLNAKFDSYGFAILKKGTRVTCKEIKELSKSTWMRIPSGWVCAKNLSKTYI